MFHVVVLCSGLLSALPANEAPKPSVAEIKTYEAARAEVGRDPEAHVRLALWCEEHGLTAERLKHLAIAVLIDPANASARGLMGLVRDQGQWRKPEEVAARVEADAELSAALAEYNERRAKLNERDADSQWRLALWCEEHGLKAEAMAHLATVVRLDPKRDSAWKRLGCVKHNGRWMTPAQIEADAAERKAQRDANAHWWPRLKSWRSALREAEHRAEAERLLAGVDDPRAVPAVLRAFGTPSPDDQRLAVQLLGQIDAVPASRALALLSVFGATDDIRRAATETLRARDVRAYAGDLIGLIRDTIAYQVRPVNGPGQPGALLVQGERFNRGRIYAPPPLPDFRLFPGEPIYYDAFGLPVVERTTGLANFTRNGGAVHVTGKQYLDGAGQPTPEGQAISIVRQDHHYDPSAVMGSLWKVGHVPQAYPMQPSDFNVDIQRTINETRVTEAYIPIGQMIAEARMSAMVMQEQLKNDVRQIEYYNKAVSEDNTRIVSVLNNVSGQNLGPDRDAWKSWWSDQLGYSYVPPRPYPRPTFVEMVPPAYVPRPVGVTEQLGPVASSKTTYAAHAQLTQSGIDRFAAMGIYRCCFGAGTPVQTLTGLKPIEDLRVGDRVLARDEKTGALNYQPILTVYHYPPSETLRLVLEDEAIVTSPLHRFWRVAEGWVMARDLKPGDTVRTLRGRGRVVSVADDMKQPVFNLNVAEDASFLVGAQGVLVHDNTLPDIQGTPFDAPPVLARAENEE